MLQGFIELIDEVIFKGLALLISNSERLLYKTVIMNSNLQYWEARPQRNLFRKIVFAYWSWPRKTDMYGISGRTRWVLHKVFVSIVIPQWA